MSNTHCLSRPLFTRSHSYTHSILPKDCYSNACTPQIHKWGSDHQHYGERRVLWEVNGSGGWAFMNGISPLVEEAWRHCWPPFALPQRRFHLWEASSSQTSKPLMPQFWMDFLDSSAVRCKFLLFITDLVQDTSVKVQIDQDNKCSSVYEEISKVWCYVHSVVSLTWKWNFHVCYIGETKDTTLMPNAVRQVCFYQTPVCEEPHVVKFRCTERGWEGGNMGS